MSKWFDADEVKSLLRLGIDYEIWQLPTIDIVRCSECKWYEESKGCLLEDNSIRQANDFCSYGKRRDNES